MPSKRDARNNNNTPSQFAYLGLHQAALSGNVGLVQYALSQGQPVDAVWDGISALHAAAAGGSEHVARLLIENGADVSFARLPRSERELKARTASSSSSSSTPIEKVTDTRNLRAERELKPRSGSSTSTSTPDALLNAGSTPLHVACAHKHTAVARLLLSHGAAPHIPDRRGVTPLDLLPPASPDPSSDALRTVIREYYEAQKAKEKEFHKSPLRFHGKAAAVLGFPREDESNSPRLGGRRSFENLLSKSPKHIPPPLMTPSPGRRTLNGIGTPPPSPRRPSVAASDRMPPSPTSSARFTFGTATPPLFSSTTAPPLPPSAPPDSSPPPAQDERRPSLPHVFEPSSSPPTPSQPAVTGGRPRSAGSGSQPPAFGSPPAVAAPTFNTAGHERPRTKRSLLSLFKKGEDATTDGVAKERERDRELEREWTRERVGSVPFAVSAGSKWSPPRLRDRIGLEEEKGLPEPHAEVRTAPAGRTTFSTNTAHIAEEVFCDEEEDYGVPLTRTPETLPPDLPESPSCTGDEASDGGFDGEDTMEDEDLDPALELDRTSTGATVRPRDVFTPPRHAEAWYRDRLNSARASGSSLGQPPPTLENDPAQPSTPRHTPASILRSDQSVRNASSRGALRFQARAQGGQDNRALHEKGSKSSLLNGRSRSLLRARSRSRSGSGSGGSADGKRDLLSVDNRMRGNSVSSASTDLSAPAWSQVSQDTTTGTAASTNSVPVPDSGRIRDCYADALFDPDGDGECPFDLNIRTVSNHAQAEALVQKAAKEILELNIVSADAEPGPNLSARLAALGETVQLERRFARGEAQRFKSPVRTRFDEEGLTGDEEEQRREDELRKAQEKMMWSQKVMDRYAKDREGGREKKVPEVVHGDKETQPDGVPLVRTASLEKEMEVGVVDPPRTRQQRVRRPHTSDSVRSSPDGSSAPPRFGHSTTHSSSSVLRGNETAESIRVFNRDRRVHHPSRSASLNPRAESLDHDRPRALLLEEPATAPLVRHESRDDPDIQPALTGTSKVLAPNTAARSAFPPPALALDDFGASVTSIRPIKQRFGTLRSLFGKGK